MMTAYYFIVGGAIILMLLGLIMAIQLKNVAAGGTIGRSVKIIMVLIVIFTVGYLVALLMPLLSIEVSLIIVGVIFLFGAVYVLLVLWIIRRLIKQVIKTLDDGTQ
ncbi:MAG: hypothetical protein QNJ97_04545 [Myxococcota bacterium]|nr:hypothetical protein [Myxococcota bacterium]